MHPLNPLVPWVEKKIRQLALTDLICVNEIVDFDTHYCEL